MFDWQSIKGVGLEEVLRRMPAGVIVVDASSGEIILANDQARQIVEQNLGYSMPPDLAGLTNFRMFHPDGRLCEAEELPTWRSLASGEEVADEEYFYPVAGGRVLWLRLDSSPIRDDEGRIAAATLLIHDITGRKRDEERLAYHASLLQNMDDAVIATDEHFAITAWNRAAEKMYGYSEDEALGARLWKAVTIEESEEQLAEARSELAGTGNFRAEWLAYHRDGSPVYIEVSVSTLRGESGEVIGYLAIDRDITEHKRYEKSLRESEERLRFALEAGGLGSWSLDLTTYELHTSQTCKANFGLPPDAEFTYETLFALIHPEDRERARAAIETAISTGEDYEADYRILTPEGEERWLSVRGRAVYAAGGTPLRMDWFTLDITERKRAQIETASRARQQSAVAELGLKALSNHGLQPLMDEAVTLTASTLEVEHCEVVELLPGGSGADKRVLLRSAAGFEEVTTGGTAGGTAELDPQTAYTMRRREPVVVEDLRAETRFEPAPLLIQHGVISSVTVMIPGRDGPFGALGAHTASLQAFSDDEANFLQSVANVIAIAVEREETETRLEEVREAERGRMARDLHDEALQALTEAIGEAQQLRSTSTEPERAQQQERIVETLSSVGQHLRGAIYDLRLEQEQDRPFEERLESLVEQHRAMAPEIEISLEVEEGPTFGAPGESSTNLLRIVGEALTNARRHSGCTGVMVSAGLDGGVFRAEVSDDGTGFDLRGGAQPDARAAPTATAGATGGIGIEAMRERARNVGAELRVESERGEGTTVSVELAAHREPRGSTRDQQADEVRVLLVEDHASVREAIASSFEQEPGFEVSGQAASLAEAREMLEASGDARPVDVAIVDLGLPDGYGGDLIKEILETYPQAQALVLSANLDRAEMARAVEAGAAAILNKTAHLTEVVDYVRRLRAGETLIALEEVVELLRFAGRRREEEHEARRAVESLTPREIEVLRALAEGLDSEGIAGRLHISVRTERNHMANILAKLGVHSQLQALVFALRHGVVESP